MTTLSTNTLNIADILRRTRPDGTVGLIAELLSEDRGLINDMTWVEGDLPNGHLSQSRTSLPTFAIRNPNGSTAPSKSTTNQSTEAPQYIESFLEVDQLVARYGGDIESKIASELPAFKESAMQKVADAVVYGNGLTTPGQITGIMPRFADTTATNGSHVILGGSLAGQTDNMSILLLNHAPGMFYGFYPKGSTGGLEIKDWGDQIVESSSNRFVARRVQWLQAFGIAIDDWRAVTRIGNIDLSLLIAGTGADLFDKLIMAVNTQRRFNGRKAIYMNSTTMMMLEIQARNDVQAGGQLSYATVTGQQIPTFQGIPINVEDTLTEAETRIT